MRTYTPEDPYAVKGERIRRELLDLVGADVGRVLSVGCGTCATEALLKKAGVEVWGLDVVGSSVEIAKSRIDRVVLGDIEGDKLVEIPEGFFDLVICGDVLEHLRFPEHALARIRSWLKPGGSLIASVPNFIHYSVLFDLFVRRTFIYEDGGIRDRGHYRIFTRKNFEGFISSNGFRVVETRFLRPLDHRWSRRAVVRPATMIAPMLNDYLVQTWIVRAVLEDKKH